MEGKYFVSKLPVLMRDNGIKNFTELSLKTGINQSSLKELAKGMSADFGLVIQLIDFFQCKPNSLYSLETKYHDYSHWLVNGENYNGIVYFLKADNGLTKIGWTANLKQRKESLEYTKKVKLHLVHYISTFDCPTLEKTLHTIFASKRVEGEWFDLTDEDIELLKEAE